MDAFIRADGHGPLDAGQRLILSGGQGCSIMVTPTSAQAARCRSRLPAVQASLASTINSALGRPCGPQRSGFVAVATKLDLEQRAVGGLCGRSAIFSAVPREIV
jgi:hypothetical protein